MATIPSIACLGIIGKNNNPLHITILAPPPAPATTTTASSVPPSPKPTPLRTPLQFSLLLTSTLDIFESRSKLNATSGGGLSGDYGLLHAIDERLAAYGFETNTGVRFVVVVDIRGRAVEREVLRERIGGGTGTGMGLREADVRVVFKAMQAAYVKLLQNPFYDPDEHSPPTGRGGKKITSRKFGEEMQRIGESWVPGTMSL